MSVLCQHMMICVTNTVWYNSDPTNIDEDDDDDGNDDT